MDREKIRQAIRETTQVRASLTLSARELDAYLDRLHDLLYELDREAPPVQHHPGTERHPLREMANNVLAAVAKTQRPDSGHL